MAVDYQKKHRLWTECTAVDSRGHGDKKAQAECVGFKGFSRNGYCEFFLPALGWCRPNDTKTETS